MNETKMTLTERNQKLYELRKKLDQKRNELAWIETEIMAVNSEYDRQNIDLFEEMFGEKNTLWDHLDRVNCQTTTDGGHLSFLKENNAKGIKAQNTKLSKLFHSSYST